MSADYLKRLAEAYPLVDEWLGGADDLNEVPSEIAEFIDLAAQLHASNRALNERIEKLEGALMDIRDVPHTYHYCTNCGISDEEQAELFMSRAYRAEGIATKVLEAADDAAQRKG